MPRASASTVAAAGSCWLAKWSRSWWCPELAGFKSFYANYRARRARIVLTAKQLFLETAAPAIEKDFRAGTFDPERLERYGFEPTQEGKLFQLYPAELPALGVAGGRAGCACDRGLGPLRPA